MTRRPANAPLRPFCGALRPSNGWMPTRTPTSLPASRKSTAPTTIPTFGSSWTCGARWPPATAGRYGHSATARSERSIVRMAASSAPTIRELRLSASGKSTHDSRSARTPARAAHVREASPDAVRRRLGGVRHDRGRGGRRVAGRSVGRDIREHAGRRAQATRTTARDSISRSISSSATVSMTGPPAPRSWRRRVRDEYAPRLRRSATEALDRSLQTS